MKLYSVLPNGPPSLTCQMALKALDIDYELVNEDYVKGDHMTDYCAKLNPQKEIPVLVNGDLVKRESHAILRYLGDKYDLIGKLYPKELIRTRVIVDRRLAFNCATYYPSISEYVMAPIYSGFERNPLSGMLVKMGLKDFEEYLTLDNTRFAASENLTLADFPLITSTMCLEAINFSLDDWPRVKKWYENFKADYPDLWEIAARGVLNLDDLLPFEELNLQQGSINPDPVVSPFLVGPNKDMLKLHIVISPTN